MRRAFERLLCIVFGRRVPVMAVVQAAALSAAVSAAVSEAEERLTKEAEKAKTEAEDAKVSWPVLGGRPSLGGRWT